MRIEWSGAKSTRMVEKSWVGYKAKLESYDDPDNE